VLPVVRKLTFQPPRLDLWTTPKIEVLGVSMISMQKSAVLSIGV